MRRGSLRCLGPHGFHKVAYVEWGAPDNPRVVVCVHGLTRNGRDFDTLAQALAPDRRVICPDIVGRGASDRLTHTSGYAYTQYVADMAMLIARSGAEQVDWVGTSMGGLIGMMLAAQPNTPIDKLVVNDVGPFIPKAALERLATYVGKMPTFNSMNALEQYVREISAPFGPLSDADWRHLTEHAAARREDGTYTLAYDPAIADAFAGPLQDVTLWPVWDAIMRPTLLLRGGASDLLLAQTAAEMSQRGPRAKLVQFEGIGHAPMLMAPDQIAVVRDFLLGR